MKKIILSSLIVLITVSVFAQQYVDLGLPSGTLWKDQNESGLYTYQEAEKSFGKVMPTAPQLNELVSFCTWEWTGAGYKITGPNGKSIVFPAEGYYTCGNDPSVKSKGEKGQYWSKTVSDNSSIAFPEWKFPYCLSVSSESKDVHFNNPDCCKFSVRLVSENETAVSKAKILQQLSESEAQAIKSEAEEQRKREEEQKRQAEEQKRQAELKKIEAEAKRKEKEEDKRLEAECISLRDIDGNQYALVMMGTQCWMRENLRTTHYADGMAISVGKIAPAWNSVIYSRYYPNGDSSNVALYGYLYNWTTATRGLYTSSKKPVVVQGICPTGWHVPSIEEWHELLEYVSSHEQYCCEDNSKKIAKAVSSSSGWIASSKKCTVGYNSLNNNTTGLNIYPAGDFYTLNNSNIPFQARYFGNEAALWSSSKGGSAELGKGISLSYDEADVGSVFSPEKYRAFSVRCLRGAGVLAEVATESRAVSIEENQANAVRKEDNVQAAFSFLGSLFKAATIIMSPAPSTPIPYNPAVGNVPAATSGSDFSNSSGSSVSQWVPIGTATGITITESGSVSSITCTVESWNNSGPPSALIDGEHYQLVRSSSSTCSGVNVSQYSYFCHVTKGARISYTVYVNF